MCSHFYSDPHAIFVNYSLRPRQPVDGRGAFKKKRGAVLISRIRRRSVTLGTGKLP